MNRLIKLSRPFSLITLLSLLTLETFASNIDASDKYAWSTNTGWVNFRPTYGEGVTVYADHLEGDAWIGNIGWIKLGRHKTQAYDNASSADYGVNHDGAGNLSGYAWGTHAGWINFNPSYGGVRIDLDTGDFSGYAWSAAVGWINFNNTEPVPYKVRFGSPSVNLSVAHKTGSEADTTAITVTVTASMPVAGEQTLFLNVTGEGISSEDYSLSHVMITIPDRQTTGEVTFTVKDDTQIEGDEIVTLTMHTPSAGIALGSTVSQEMTIIDNETNNPPVLEAIDNQTVVPGTLVTLQAIATDLDNQSLSFNLTTSAIGATLNPVTGQFNWQTTQAGTYPVTIEVTDGELSDSKTFDIIVTTTPILDSIEEQNVFIGTPLTFTAQASTYPVPDQLRFSLIEGPEGAMIDENTGVFNWTPSSLGTFTAKIKVTETITQLTHEQIILITVSNNTPPELTPIENQVAPLNRPFELQIEAVDAQNNKLFYRLEKSPPKAILDQNGKLIWNPEKVGTYPFTISVIENDGDPINLTASIEFEVIVNTKPVINKLKNQTVNMGNTLEYRVNAFHPLGNPLGFQLINSPPGAKIDKIDKDTSVLTWTPERAGTYELQIQAFDENNQTFMDTQTMTLTADLVETRLMLELSSNTILFNGPLKVTGNLFREVKTDISLGELPIELTILGPSQTWHLSGQTQADDGAFQIDELPVLAQEGTYSFRAHFYGDDYFAKSQSEPQTLNVREVVGYAILIQGRTADDEDGVAAYNKTMNRVYRIMKQQGFKDEDIEYFNFNTEQSQINIEVDAQPSISAIQGAFKKLQDSINAAPAPLFIVMVDHGGIDGTFYIDQGDGASIKTAEVSGWLDTLEAGLNPDALAQPRLVLVGSCYAGTFLPPLSKPGRTIIVSAAADEESYKGPKEPDETRSGEFFTEAFFSWLARNKSVKKAFELATIATEITTRQKDDEGTVITNRFQDNAAQHPLLDDNGDKIGSNVLSTGFGDGLLAEDIYLGSGLHLEKEEMSAHITDVTETRYLDASTSVTELFAVVNNANRVKDHQVIVDIRPPSVDLDYKGVEAKSALEIDELIRKVLPASSEPNRFSGHFDVFQKPGKYEVIYFVVDTNTGERAPFERSLVYKNRVGNLSPEAFHLQVPKNESEPGTTLIFDWDRALDPDIESLTYTLLIATSSDFQRVIYRQEEIALSMSYLENNTPIDDELKDSGLGLRDGTQYYWQVVAVDPFGARAMSEVFSFTTNNTNCDPNCPNPLKMAMNAGLNEKKDRMRSQLRRLQPVTKGKFVFPDLSYYPDIYQEQGQYYMLLPMALHRAIVTADGFEDKEIEIDTRDGFASLHITLEPKTGTPPSPGQLQFATANTTVNENQEMLSVLVKREGGSDGIVSINYASEDDTALDGPDYLANPGTLTWADKDNLPKRITIKIKNDTKLERDKKFQVKLSEPTGNATLGSIQKILVTIFDDDWPAETPSSENSTGDSSSTENSTGDSDSATTPPNSETTLPNSDTTSDASEGANDANDANTPYTGPNQLQFVTTDYFISEGDSAGNFPVTRLGNTEQPVSVQYAINGGSATAEEDYVGGSGTLTWLAGDDLPKYPELTIVDDDETEENETIELYLFNPIGEEIRLGDLTQATLIISDNDGPIVPPTVQFSAENYTVYEGYRQPITLTVTRTGTRHEGEASVQYFATHDGTAIANIDYQGELFGQLTWADGESEPKSITLQVMDDKALENPETVLVKLFNASGEITLGTPAETTLTIIDDERLLPTIPLSLGLGMGVANDGALYDAISLKNLFDTQVLFWGGAKLKGQDYSTTLFSQPSQMVEIVGEIHVDPKHVGKVADILVVATTLDEASQAAPLLLMLDNGGQVQVWDGDITTLVGIEENLVLPKIQLLEIYQGFLEPIRLQIYFGYLLQEDGFIYFNGEQPIKVWVEEEHEYSLADDNSILFADWTQDGQLLVTASQDELVRLWDLNTGSRLAGLRGHTDTVTTARFSPDNRQILTASADHTARLWEVATLQELLIFQGHTGKVTSTAFSPDGQNIITTSADKTARLWDAKTGENRLILEGHEEGVQYATFSHDGKQIATASWDHTARLWDAEIGEELAVLAGHEDMVEHVAFSPDDQSLVTTSWDQTARLWDAHTGQEIFTLIGHYNGVAYAAFSPDGEYLVTTSWDNNARLWAVETGEPIWARGHQAGVHHAAFSPDGQLIITGGNDGTARLWETATGKPLHTLQGHQDNVWQVGFTPDGKRIISASWDNSVRIWEIESGEVVMVLKD